MKKLIIFLLVLFSSVLSYAWTGWQSDGELNNVFVGGSVSIGTTSTSYPLYVAIGTTTTNVTAALITGTINNYMQLNVQNLSSGNTSSSDIVATANNGTEIDKFIDMGINGSGYSAGVVGAANDAYLYSKANNMYIGIGTTATSYTLGFINGGTNVATSTKMIIDGSGNVGIGTSTSSNMLTVGQAGSSNVLVIPSLKAASGTRFLCISTTGVVSSSASACSGT